MNIISFDTCLDKMYVALGNEEKVLTSKIVETTKDNYHSAYLISTITNVLKENNLTPKDIDVIATNIGPGSFTGIRACVTVTRVLAQGIEKDVKAIGVSSLEIISRINNTDKKTLVALDARKEMAYVGIYDNKKEIFAPKAILIEDLKNMLQEDEYFVITDNVLKEEIGGISYQQGKYDLGEALIQITREKLESGVEGNWRKLLPLYIQPPAIHCKKG